MCDPVTIALVASTAVATIGTVFSGVSAAKQQTYESGIARNNAVYAQRASEQAQKAGDIASVQQSQRLSLLKGNQVAAMAANGVDVSMGSPLDVQKDTAVLGSQDAQNLRDQTARQVQGFQIDSMNYSLESQAHASAASGAYISTGINAFSTILGGVSKVAGGFGGGAKTPSYSSLYGTGGFGA